MSIELIIFLFLTILFSYLSFILTKSTLKKVDRKIFIIGHRGVGGIAPENTITSFKKALKLQVDYIELDVHLSADDSIIVMHDDTVNRTTNGRGKISDLTLKEIKTLDAGSWFSKEFEGEKIPTLPEVLDLVNGRTKLLIELKWPTSGIYKNLAKAIVNEISKCHAESWVILQSFERSYLEEVHSLAPGIELQELIFGQGKILPVYFNRKLHIGKFKSLPFSKSVNIFYLYLDKKFIRQQKKSGKSVYAFGLNTKQQMIKAINLGVDGIITNLPQTARELMELPQP